MDNEQNMPEQFTFRIHRNGKSQTFDRDRIVGILREEGKRDESSCTLLYVEVAEGDGPEAAKKVAERTVFKSTPIYGAPPDLVNAYGPDDASFWIGDLAGSYTGTSEIHVIVSTGSGTHQARRRFEKLVEPFLQVLGLAKESNYAVHTTESADSILDLARTTLLPRATSGAHLSLILLSGDGGVVDLVNGLMGPPSPSDTNSLPESYVRPKLALIPTGTGNALANSTGALSDNTLGLSTLYRGRPCPLPIFSVQLSPDSVMLDGSGSPVHRGSHHAHFAAGATHRGIALHGAVVFSYGLHASLVADSDTPEYRRHGAQRFGMAAKDLLYPPDGSPAHEYRAKVSLLKRGGDGADANGAEWAAVPRATHSYVLATLVAQLERGFTVSPASQPLDGALRVVHFGEMERGGEAIMELMKAAYAGGRHVEDEKVGYEEVEGLKVEFEGGEEEERWRRVCVDGKIFVVGKGGNVVVRREEETCLDLMWFER